MSDALCSRCNHPQGAHIVNDMLRNFTSCHVCWFNAAAEYRKTKNFVPMCQGYLDPLAHALEVRFGAV